MSPILLNGFFVGLIYGLVGLGLAVAYRGSGVINFAYGETGMIGAFAYAELRVGREELALPRDHGLWLALCVGVGIAAVLGALTEYLVVRPLRKASRIRALVGTFALATLYFSFAARRWGLNVRRSKPLIEGRGVVFAGLRVVPQQLLILAISVVVLIGLHLLYKHTAFGLKLRAVAADSYAAGLAGINVNRTSLMCWALVGALSGLSAILISPLVGFSVAFMTILTIRGLASAVIGGLTATGALVAGVVLGVVEGFVAYKTPIAGASEVLIALLMLIVLALRPPKAVAAEF